jgi:methyl-accepting chemotaxis protein
LLRRLTLGTKLYGSFALIVIITCAAFAAGILLSQSISAQTTDLSRTHLAGLAAAGEIRAVATAYRQLELQHAASGMIEERSVLEGRASVAAKGMQAPLDRLAKLAPASELAAAREGVKAAWTAYSNESGRLFALARDSAAAGDLSPAPPPAAATGDLFGAVESRISALDALLAKKAALAAAAVVTAAERARNLLAAGAAASIVAALALAASLRRGITRPARQLLAMAHALASGDLTVRPPALINRDEIGLLGASLDGALERLRDALRQVDVNSRHFVTTSDRLATTAGSAARSTASVTSAIARTMAEIDTGASNQEESVRQALTVVEQLDSAIQQIASGSQDQARSVTQTSSVLGQVANAVQQVAATAQALAAASTQTSAAADKGGQSVLKTIAGMDRIKEASGQTAERIREMVDYSKQIGQIVDVISDIARQTNLLALNAAIEAARAGEHGKGFAVVADAVRSLAERSAKATKEIGTLISSIQKATDNAIRATDAGNREVEEGSSLAREAGMALEEILKTVEETNREIRTITAATQQIAANATQAVQAMDSVATVTEESTAATQEMAAGAVTVKRAVADISAASTQSSAAIREATKSAAEIETAVAGVASATSSLAGMARELQAVVGRFKI